MNKVEWILLIGIVAILVGPFATIKAVSTFRRRRKLPPPQPYKDDDET